MELSNRKFRLADGILIPLRLAPVQTVGLLLYTLVGGAIPALNVGATTSFINTALEILNGGAPLSAIVVPLVLVLLVVAFNTVAGNILQFVRVRLTIRLREPLREAFLEKRARLVYAHIENQEDWDLISRATTHPEERLIEVLDTLLSIASMVISSASIIAILVTQVWWAGLIIIAVSIPLLYLSAKGGEKSYDAEREATKIRRKYEYLFDILTNRDAVAERTMFGFSGKLDNVYGQEYERARLIQYKVVRKWFIRMKTGGVATALISVLVALVLAQPVAAGTITVGMFISLVSAIMGMAQSLSWQLANSMQGLARNREYMKDLTAFMELSEEEGGESLPEPAREPFRTLEFRHVFFRYPGMETDILKDLSFRMESGKHYSFVGINGAGKTTITKLLTGLFTNYEGEILLNGRELREYTQAQLKAVFCGVFQDFARYQITAFENIALGNARLLEPENGRADSMESFPGAEAVRKAAALAGLTPAVEKLPKGFDTLLGKLHDEPAEKKEAPETEKAEDAPKSGEGVDLSGGEWQRLAMARAVHSPSEVKILDEPTAALDPIAESEVYEKFQELSDGKTTVFISHRLGSTLFADTIYVLEDGRIAESGSHAELMAGEGIYAEMFESQRSWYK